MLINSLIFFVAGCLATYLIQRLLKIGQTTVISRSLMLSSLRLTMMTFIELMTMQRIKYLLLPEDTSIEKIKQAQLFDELIRQEWQNATMKKYISIWPEYFGFVAPFKNWSEALDWLHKCAKAAGIDYKELALPNQQYFDETAKLLSTLYTIEDIKNAPNDKNTFEG